MTIKYSKQEQLAIDTANGIVAVGTAQASIDANCQAIRKARKGKALGTVKSGDAVMIRFTETLSQAGKSEQTIKNYATAFRKAVNDGVPFSMNAYRDAKKKGAKSTKSATKSVKVTIKGEPSEAEVAKMLRDAVNAESFRESYAQLAAFLIDALDEYDGE
jgi:undecaprenyl pyrophosphate synthase